MTRVTTALVLVATFATAGGCETPSYSEAGARSVAGTTWIGTDFDDVPCTFRFLEGGAFAYESPAGSWRDPPDSWSQFGYEIGIDVNDGYARYRGVIRGTTMSGRAANEDGDRWEWSVEKQEKR